jgi:Ni,Fe-hydrogenase I cytochrome b subunit
VLNPQLTWAYLYAADVFMKQNQLVQAEVYLKCLLVRELREDRTYVFGLVKLGDVYLRTRRADLARQAFCEALTLNRWGERAADIEQRINDLKGSID